MKLLLNLEIVSRLRTMLHYFIETKLSAREGIMYPRDLKVLVWNPCKEICEHSWEAPQENKYMSTAFYYIAQNSKVIFE